MMNTLTSFADVVSVVHSINFITARVAKRAKVMFSQACVTSPDNTSSPPPPRDHVATPPSPSLGPGHNTSLPLARVKGHNTSLPPWDQVTTPPPCPGSKVTTPTSPPWDQVITPPSDPSGTRSQHLPPPWDQVTTFSSPSLWDQVTTIPPGTMRRWAVRILLECILV